jgi:DNA mismatch repair protein MutL
MARIKILPEILSNKIAAGEVVERPAAVVKELVENALDAGADRITIDIEKGGRTLVRVADNGCGMGADDALLALERYATSKIDKEADLFAIRTLGFRGEALPSIAAVSRFELITKNAESDVGTAILVSGGKIRKVAQSGAPEGTMISVRQLFFNTPARRKFLKATATEMGHIVDAVMRTSLAWPKVRFVLNHNGRRVKRLSVTDDRSQRVAAVFGIKDSSRLGVIEQNDATCNLTGWVAAVELARATTRGIYTYVNGRFVRDKVLQHALMAGYQGHLMKGRFPLAALFLEVPPDQVDVNVHPAKQEVRFIRQKAIHDTVAAAVAESVLRLSQPRWETSPQELSGNFSRDDPEAPQIAERPFAFARPKNVSSYNEPNFDAVKTDLQAVEPDRWRGVTGDKTRTAQTDLWQIGRFGSLRVIGQLKGTYILCESEKGLVLIDQHAAHERIYYERLKKQVKEGTPQIQQLLVPETVELGYREADAIKGMLPELKATGLDIESFGGNTFVVKGVPTFLEQTATGPLLMEMAEKILVQGASQGLAAIYDTCVKLMACHGALRAGAGLHETQITALLKQLDRCDNPSNCPHGRPTWIEWSKALVEKAFGRRA